MAPLKFLNHPLVPNIRVATWARDDNLEPDLCRYLVQGQDLVAAEANALRKAGLPD